MNMPSFFWIILLPLAGSPVVYLLGRASEIVLAGRVAHPARTGGGAHPARGGVAWGVSLFLFVLAWIALAVVTRDMAAQGAPAARIGGITLQLDGIGLLISTLALALGTLVTLYSGPYLSQERHSEKYYAMLVAMTGAMIGLACAGDLFNLWLWFEMMALASYLLVSFYREQPATLEAGVKYFVQSAAGSVLVLLGISLVLAERGTLDLLELQAAAGAAPLLRAAGALLVVGFGVKVALVPLHTWLPDAHSQAPSGVSALLSGIVIETGLIALLRVLPAAGGAALPYGPLLMGAGAVNLLVGNLLALRQTQVKRLLAFSSLSHVGYMLVGLGIALSSGEAAGAAGGFFHLLTHGLMKSLAFLGAGALLYALFLSRGRHEPLMIADLAGAANRYPVVALTLAVALLGLGGLPPLAGFMSKWQIFAAGFATRDGAIQGVVLFAALNSVLSLVYYAPLVNALYRRDQSDAVRQGGDVPLAMQLPLALLAAVIIAAGIWPGLLSGMADAAGAALMASY